MKRLSQEPRLRLIGSEKIWERDAGPDLPASVVRTEVLVQDENLAGLEAINPDLIARAESVDSPELVVLDMDGTDIPAYDMQEQSASNDYFESLCYNSLLRFNWEGTAWGSGARSVAFYDQDTGAPVVCVADSPGEEAERIEKLLPARGARCIRDSQEF